MSFRIQHFFLECIHTLKLFVSVFVQSLVSIESKKYIIVYTRNAPRLLSEYVHNNNEI